MNNCLSCQNLDLDSNKKICSKCKDDFYPLENDLLKIGEYINCYKEPKGYYLDKNDSLYKKCYYTCEECNKKGEELIHNCLICDKNYSFEIRYNNYINCYQNCSYYYYFDNNFTYHCSTNASCPNEYPRLIQNKSECVKDEIYLSSEIINEEYSSKKLLNITEIIT